MLDMPILKFEKSTNYLNDQLNIQLNNKQLVSDIISNIKLILPNTSESTTANYLNIQNSANDFLQIVSQNITTIEELKREIKHITYDLTEVLSQNNRKNKSKEYYIAAISTVKNNIEQYTLKFQNIEKKLEKDNIDFNDFINKNNFKYNFISNTDTNTYEFSSFSIDNQDFSNGPIPSSSNLEEISEVQISKKDEKIDELTNEFKNMLSDLSEDAVLSFDLISSLKTEFQENTVLESEESNIENSSTNEETAVEKNEETIVEEANLDETTVEETSVGENVVDENTTDETNISENVIEENLKTSENTEDLVNMMSSQIAEDFDNIEKLETANSQNTFENSDFSVENNIQEINNEEKTEETETPGIIIDYASIYGNYSSNISSNIEDDIYNEYSIFSENSNNNFESKNVQDTTISSEDELLELSDEDLLNEILKDEIEKNISSQPENLSETNENINNDINELSDDDLLAELLISESSDELLSDSIDEKQENTSQNIDQKNENKKEKTAKINYTNFSNYDLEETIRTIKEASTNNYSLIISEKQNKIFLPYTIDELEKYLKSYPEVYNSLVDVVNQEFILPFDTFFKHPAMSRFTETYNLMRNRQGKSILSSLIYSFKLLGKYNLNPAIIAACKTENQLDNYLYYLTSNELDKFKLFNIIYDITPLKQ